MRILGRSRATFFGKSTACSSIAFSLLVALQACSGGGGGGTPSPSPTPTGSPAPTPTPTPTPTSTPPPPAYGTSIGFFDPALSLRTGNTGAIGGSARSTYAFSVQQTASGEYKIHVLGGQGSIPLEYDKTDEYLVEGSFESVDYIDAPSLYANGLVEPEITVLSEAADKLFWLHMNLRFFPYTFRVMSEIDVEAPCYVEGTNTYWAGDVLVGQRGLGMSLFEIDTGLEGSKSDGFTSQLRAQSAPGRSLCWFLRGTLPAQFMIDTPQLRVYSDTLATAIDYETNEIVYLGDAADDGFIEELGSVAILTESSKSLEIVDVISHGTSNQSPRYFLVLMTDGNDPGEHRLVRIALEDQLDSLGNSAGEILTQKVVHAWEDGVPVGMVQAPLGGQQYGGYLYPDLAVVLGTTDHSFFFDNITFAPGEPPDYSDPVKFNVGKGAGSAIAVDRPDGPQLDEPSVGMLVSFPDTGEVTFIIVDDELTED